MSYIADHADNNPDKPAIITSWDNNVVTFGQLDKRSSRLANLISKRGVQEVSNLAMWMKNGPQFLEAAWAAQRSGKYYTPLSTRLTPAEAAYIISDCDATVLVVSDELTESAVKALEILDSEYGGQENIKVKLVTGTTDYSDVFESYERLIENEEELPKDREKEGQDMLYSSGTTGKPKGVRLSLPQGPIGSPTPVSMVAQGLYGMDDSSIYLSPAPLYHAAPLQFTMAALRIGATTVVMDKFDPLDFLRTIEHYKVTHTQVVPTMMVRLAKMPREVRSQFDISSLKCMLHAAAPCPVDIKKQIIEWLGPVVYEYYAGTERNGFCAIDSNEWLTHPGSVGRSLIGKVHILDEEGNDLPPGAPGTIYFEGTMPFEYYKDPDKTASSRNKQGWTTLGDIGYLDEEGYLYLTDRKAFMIVTGGVNVYPQEAENLLITHPAVVDAAVFGIPNEEFGEEVKAVVQPTNMDEAGPELETKLITYLKTKLADIKCPRSIDFEAELPRAPNGKLYKQQLRDRYWEGRQSKII